ncbi:hypothetical protein [Xanthomarina gelatinilytica]|uniref:hypothetical protein n=1 Tax=Xanthomarina gelatinilytica TaxID=1137281 RepID=UPI003AA972DC
MEIEIKKAKIKNRIFLSSEYVEKLNGVNKTRKEDSDAIVHDDLINAFQRLVPHFALLTEQVPESEVESIILNGKEIPEDLLQKIKVTGITVGGTGESEGITISGAKRLSNGKMVNFNTPFTKWEEVDEGYRFISELINVLEDLKDEVIAYMEGKQGSKVQMEMAFDQEDEAADFNIGDSEENQELEEATA